VLPCIPPRLNDGSFCAGPELVIVFEEDGLDTDESPLDKDGIFRIDSILGLIAVGEYKGSAGIPSKFKVNFFFNIMGSVSDSEEELLLLFINLRLGFKCTLGSGIDLREVDKLMSVISGDDACIVLCL